MKVEYWCMDSENRVFLKHSHYSDNMAGSGYSCGCSFVFQSIFKMLYFCCSSIHLHVQLYIVNNEHDLKMTPGQYVCVDR